MGKFDLPQEQACPRCNGSGVVEAAPGDRSAFQAPSWSREYGRAVCGRCKGRGYLLMHKKREVLPPGETEPLAAPDALYQQDAAEAVVAQAQQAIVGNREYDPDGEKRRVFALNVAMSAFALSGGQRGMFGGGGVPEMDADEIVPLAREVEFFLRGD